MSTFKVGEKVLFSLGSDDAIGLKENIGLIVGLSEDDYIILNRTSGHNSIYRRKIVHLTQLDKVDEVRDEIRNHYSVKLDELRGRIRKVTSEEKIKERVKKYNDTKGMILKNCERIVTCSDDDEFEGRLKEIGNLKKVLHAINLECGDILRKENGKVKYDIRRVEIQMNGSLNKISDASIIKASKY